MIISSRIRKQWKHLRNNWKMVKINATIRRELGRDIDGSCGQLRRSYIGQ